MWVGSAKLAYTLNQTRLQGGWERLSGSGAEGITQWIRIKAYKLDKNNYMNSSSLIGNLHGMMPLSHAPRTANF